MSLLTEGFLLSREINLLQLSIRVSELVGLPILL